MKENYFKGEVRKISKAFGLMFSVMVIIAGIFAIYSLLFYAMKGAFICAIIALIPYFFIEITFYLLAVLCFYAAERLQE